jgi:hypothetical protein
MSPVEHTNFRGARALEDAEAILPQAMMSGVI